MSVMSIRINDAKRKTLKIIASIEGKSMSGIVSVLIDDYIKRNKKKINEIAEKEDLTKIMHLSEKSFSEWNNDEDEIYNDL